MSVLGSFLPPMEPCYAILSWHSTEGPSLSREISQLLVSSCLWPFSDGIIVFIYCCPSGSPVKLRMVYASGAYSTHLAVKNIISSSSAVVNTESRRVETSDPNELNDSFLKLECGLSTEEINTNSQTRVFAKPKGPPRRR